MHHVENFLQIEWLHVRPHELKDFPQNFQHWERLDLENNAAKFIIPGKKFENINIKKYSAV